MDVRALGEALLAVAITPVVSITLAFLVVAGIIFLAMKVARAENTPRQLGEDKERAAITPDAGAS